MCVTNKSETAYFHLPGLFEFYEFYKEFLPLYHEHREFFYDWCEIGSIYGAPSDCLWGGGRVGFGTDDAKSIIKLLDTYGISARLTFSNSLIREEHLNDKRCNELCELFTKRLSGTSNYDTNNQSCNNVENGIIIYSELLLGYLKEKYPEYYFVSSTTKVITEFDDLIKELNREEFRYVVPDFRLNACRDKLASLTAEQKRKVELLVNECCSFTCTDRKKCYESVSRKSLGEDDGHYCKSPNAREGYVFSKAMQNPGFIGVSDIKQYFLKNGFSHFKIEGRSLGSALILEFILYYMTKPEYQLNVRENIYLDNSLDLF